MNATSKSDKLCNGETASSGWCPRVSAKTCSPLQHKTNLCPPIDYTLRERQPVAVSAGVHDPSACRYMTLNNHHSKINAAIPWHSSNKSDYLEGANRQQTLQRGSQPTTVRWEQTGTCNVEFLLLNARLNTHWEHKLYSGCGLRLLLSKKDKKNSQRSLDLGENNTVCRSR